ncbi:MAG: Crp/Fnr family transcriptional regulator [Hyphomicrobiales bacterium]|nr:Crp/Fnr family transcriptional regulator [Hyphomicrobiales bacterium]
MGSGVREDCRSWIDGTPLGRSVSAATIARMDKLGVRHVYEKGQEIIGRSDELQDVFLLVDGVARVIVYSASGKAVNFRRLEAGALFGEFAAIDGLNRSASVEAVESCRAVSISAQLFNELMQSDARFMRFVLSHLVSILRALTSRIIEFSTLGVTSRIQTELLRMANAAPGRNGQKEISPAPTHSEIAGRISTHREAVSREVSRLKQLGIIERRGRALIVKDVEQLEQMVRNASGEQLE